MLSLPASGFHRLQIRAAIESRSKFEGLPRDRIFHGIRMGGELVADCGPDQVGAIGVKPFVNQQIDTSKVDIADVDCDFFGLARLVPQPMHICRQNKSPYTI